MEKDVLPPQYSPSPGETQYGTQMTSMPAPGYPPANIGVVTIVPQPALGPSSQAITCPSCHAPITTRVKSEATTKTHLLALLACGICCCCLPYMIDSCKNRNHYCPNCNAFLGHYS